MRRTGEIFPDEILHLVIDLDRMHQGPLFQNLRHTKSSITGIGTDLQHPLGAHHPTEQLQQSPLQMAGKHTRTKEVDIGIPIQRLQQVSLLVDMGKYIGFYLFRKHRSFPIVCWYAL